jgi:hypothetical protein
VSTVRYAPQCPWAILNPWERMSETHVRIYVQLDHGVWDWVLIRDDGTWGDPPERNKVVH